MIKKSKRSIYLFVVTCLVFCLLPSCTYDYFEDETNYSVYVPKADAALITDDYRVEDLRILIYQDLLEHDTKIAFPFAKNARTKAGNYNYKLYPRQHSVFCFGNTSILDIFLSETFSESGFGIEKAENNIYSYTNNISSFLFEKKDPYITYPGPKINDTVLFNTSYFGQICLLFNNLQVNGSPLNYNQVDNIHVEATGVGTFQNLSLLTDSLNTRSSRYTENDIIRLNTKPLLDPNDTYRLGVKNYFFPSLADNPNGAISLKVELQDTQGQSIYSLNVDVTDILHMNQTICLGIDGDKVYKLTLDGPESWNPTITIEDNNTPGGGGIEI